MQKKKLKIDGITAIAVDIRKNVDGTDFVLAEGQSVFAVINMKAPASAEKVHTEAVITPTPYPATFNNVYAATTVMHDNVETVDFMEQDYTTVKYHVVGDVHLTKVNMEDHEETISGITFRLYGTSKYGTTIDMQATTDRYGQLAFQDMEWGNYKLVEYSEDPDWQADHNERTSRVTNTQDMFKQCSSLTTIWTSDSAACFGNVSAENSTVSSNGMFNNLHREMPRSLLLLMWKSSQVRWRPIFRVRPLRFLRFIKQVIL